LFGLNEFSLRLPSVLFGVAAIFAAYLLGKAVFNRPIGLLTAAVMAFSMWEIEISRYARFYTAFQFMYIVSLFCFYRGFMLGERNYKLGFVAAAFGTFSFHDLGVMLTTCFLIPFFSGSDTSPRRKWTLGASAVGLGGLWALYPVLLKPLNAMADPIDYSHGHSPGVGAVQKIKAMIHHRFNVPNLHFVLRLPEEHFSVFLVLTLTAVGASAYLVCRFMRKKDDWRALWAVPMIGSAFCHQFGLLLILLLVYLVIFARDWRTLTEPVLRTVYAVAAVCLVFWIPILDASTERKISVTRILFDYPNVYNYFLKWFLIGWPIMTAVIALGCAILALRFISNRTLPAPFFMIGTIFIPVLITSFLRNEFYEARYTFHLYPMMVIVFAMVSFEAWTGIARKLPFGKYGRTAVAAVLFAVTLFISQDANPVSAWQIGNRTYRSRVNPIKGVENWRFYADFHQDHKTPGLYVRDHLKPDDIVLAAGGPHMIALYDYYVGRVEYMITEKIEGFQIRLEDGTIRDHVTGSEILDSPARVKKIIDRKDGNGIWLLADRKLLVNDNHYLSEPMKDYLRSLTKNPDYVGMDKQTFAVRIR
jgi:hypothetical protein